MMAKEVGSFVCAWLFFSFFFFFLVALNADVVIITRHWVGWGLSLNGTACGCVYVCGKVESVPKKKRDSGSR